MYLFYIVIFIFLVYDKWRSEISTRNDYSKNVTIEDTRLLMYETLKRYFGETLTEKILDNDILLSLDHVRCGIIKRQIQLRN